MLEVTYETKATLFTNGAALLILAGMLAYTSLYRRRGKPEDRLFFTLIITDMAAAVFGSSIIWLYEADVSLPTVLYTLVFTLFFSVYVVFGVLWWMYLMFRLGRTKAKVQKALPKICIPAAALVLIYMSFLYTDFVEWEGMWLGELFINPFNILTLAPILIYGIITGAMTFGRNKRICILCGVLIIVNGLFLMLLDVDITPLILTIYLIYAHLFAMRDPFYGEVS